ncbi:MAG: efflux RND transporter periplasmic adaptor subunit [Francisellaceae bacterium]
MQQDDKDGEMKPEVGANGKKANHKALKYGITIVVLLLVCLGFYLYIRHNDIYPSTDDAYVNADIVHVAAQVSGKVETIDVQNNERVKKGQLLFSIEPQAYQYALDQARANLELEKRQVDAIKDNVRLQEAKLDQAQAQKFVAQQKANRIEPLVYQGQATKEEGDEVKGDLDVAIANVAAAKASISEQQKQLMVQKAKIAATEAALADAQLNLSYTRVYAAADGYITDFSLRKGSMINAGNNLFVLVEDAMIWVDANYKETQMSAMRPGQAATIVLDMYPDLVIKGKIQSISHGSGSVFSLLPPENATGNWVKVTQRFPVKIAIDKSLLEKLPPLRVGASATVTVNTRS